MGRRLRVARNRHCSRSAGSSAGWSSVVLSERDPGGASSARPVRAVAQHPVWVSPIRVWAKHALPKNALYSYFGRGRTGRAVSYSIARRGLAASKYLVRLVQPSDVAGHPFRRPRACARDVSGEVDDRPDRAYLPGGRVCRERPERVHVRSVRQHRRHGQRSRCARRLGIASTATTSLRDRPRPPTLPDPGCASSLLRPRFARAVPTRPGAPRRRRSSPHLRGSQVGA